MSAKTDMPIFVIGLERLKAVRYQRVLNDLAELGVDATLWRAVDGTLPIEFEPGESVKRFQLYNYALMGRGLLKTEIACYLSHYRLWKHAFEKQNCERIVVFEDDATVDAARFKQALASVAKLDQSFEYVNLRRRRRGKGAGTALAVGDGASYALYAGGYWEVCGMFAYSISRQGFKKLAPALTPINQPIDAALRDLIGKVNLRVWAVFPWLCYVDRSVASSIRDYNAKIGRELVMLALLPLRWIYEARLTTDWKTAATGAPASRFAYAKTLTATLFQVGFKRTKSGPLGRLAYRFLKGARRGGA